MGNSDVYKSDDLESFALSFDRVLPRQSFNEEITLVDSPVSSPRCVTSDVLTAQPSCAESAASAVRRPALATSSVAPPPPRPPPPASKRSLSQLFESPRPAARVESTSLMAARLQLPLAVPMRALELPLVISPARTEQRRSHSLAFDAAAADDVVHGAAAARAAALPARPCSSGDSPPRAAAATSPPTFGVREHETDHHPHHHPHGYIGGVGPTTSDAARTPFVAALAAKPPRRGSAPIFPRLSGVLASRHPLPKQGGGLGRAGHPQHRGMRAHGLRPLKLKLGARPLPLTAKTTAVAAAAEAPAALSPELPTAGPPLSPSPPPLKQASGASLRPVPGLRVVPPPPSNVVFE